MNRRPGLSPRVPHSRWVLLGQGRCSSVGTAPSRRRRAVAPPPSQDNQVKTTERGLDSSSRTVGTALLGVKRSRSICVRKLGQDGSGVHGLLYPTAVLADQYEHGHRQEAVDTDPLLVRPVQVVGHGRWPGHVGCLRSRGAAVVSLGCAWPRAGPLTRRTAEAGDHLDGQGNCSGPQQDQNQEEGLMVRTGKQGQAGPGECATDPEDGRPYERRIPCAPSSEPTSHEISMRAGLEVHDHGCRFLSGLPAACGGVPGRPPSRFPLCIGWPIAGDYGVAEGWFIRSGHLLG